MNTVSLIEIRTPVVHVNSNVFRCCLSAALDNSTLAEHQAQTSLLEEQLLRGRTDDKERYEKERAQWQRDRDSLTVSERKG